MKIAGRKILIIILLLSFIAIVVISMVFLTPKPPVEQMEYARQCLSEAVKKNAGTYSTRIYNEAAVSYDSAMANWKKQNERFIFFRDYATVLKFAEKASEKALEATESSISATTTLKTRVGNRLDTLNRIAAELNKLFNAYPLESETRNRISKGKMLLEEADLEYSKGHYLVANRKTTESEYLLKTSLETASESLRSYFRSFPQWKSWVDQTVRNSKKSGGNSIIIDKFSRKLYIYQKGVRKLEFNAELGKNWVGDKRVKGDHATPEGMYKVAKKLDSRKTKYHKALLLDYPNAEDVAKFKAEIANGTLPASAKIGGLIEIHGNGGKGIDWTEGCVALTDKEMDIVFKYAVPGTPVTIVGSMTDLPDLLNQ